MSLREQLQSIYDQHARLTPALVVDVARPADHPLHDRFEWDDSIAGEAWRRAQAQELIRSVKVVYKSDAEGDKKVRAFHAVRRSGESIYEPIENIFADPALTAILLQDMQREWFAMKRRYEHMAEFWQMVSAEASERTVA